MLRMGSECCVNNEFIGNDNVCHTHFFYPGSPSADLVARHLPGLFIFKEIRKLGLL